MGFLNPWLYSEGYQALTDVVGGYSKGCDGWDTQSGREVPGAGVIGERGAYWNGTEGGLRVELENIFHHGKELTDLRLGWDPATGLGMPNFKQLLKLAMGDNVDVGDDGQEGFDERGSDNDTKDGSKHMSAEKGVEGGVVR